MMNCHCDDVASIYFIHVVYLTCGNCIKVTIRYYKSLLLKVTIEVQHKHWAEYSQPGLR